MRKEDITAAALEMLGTPFHAQASLKGVGTDCIGVGKHIARKIGFPFKDIVDYSMRPTGELQPRLDSLLTRVYGEPQEGDILLMRWEKLDPHHIAIYMGNNQILHAYAQVRKVVMQTYTEEWKMKTVAVYRFPGVE